MKTLVSSRYQIKYTEKDNNLMLLRVIAEVNQVM